MIDYKSTGMLLNDLITTGLKIRFIGTKKEFIQRQKDILEVLKSRRCYYDLEEFNKVEKHFTLLQSVLHDLWWEQEILYQNLQFDTEDHKKCLELAIAGVNSLKLNARRSEIIREIDSILGEESSTVLEKSFKDAR